MSDIGAILQQLKGWTPLATVLGLIVVTSYFQVWVWGRQLVEMRAMLERELNEVKEARDKWERVAFRAAGLAEDTFVIAKRKSAD